MRNFLKHLTSMSLGVILLLPTIGWSQEKETKYPTKPIDLIVAYNPGAGTDIAARAIASLATKKFGVPVNVVNVPAASGVTGVLQVMRSSPDGYTMLMDGSSTSSQMLAVRPNLPLKLGDRTYIARVFTDCIYFICNVGTGWKTLEDALQVVRTRPEEFKWGAGSFGSAPMFAQAILFQAAGISWDIIKKTRMVVFEKGNAPSVQACATGDIQFAVTMTKELASMLATKRVRALAVNSPARTKEYPDVPTCKELGYPESDYVPSYGISGPKGLPENVIRAWDDLLRVEGREAAAKAKKIYSYLPPTEFEAFVFKSYQKILATATQLGIRK